MTHHDHVFFAFIPVHHDCESVCAYPSTSYSYWPGCLKSCLRTLCNALRRHELMMTTLHRPRRRISQTMAQMSCTYICSMMSRGLISRSKASRKASNSSADSVMSNG